MASSCSINANSTEATCILGYPVGVVLHYESRRSLPHRSLCLAPKCAPSHAHARAVSQLIRSGAAAALSAIVRKYTHRMYPHRLCLPRRRLRATPLPLRLHALVGPSLARRLPERCHEFRKTLDRKHNLCAPSHSSQAMSAHLDLRHDSRAVGPLQWGERLRIAGEVERHHVMLPHGHERSAFHTRHTPSTSSRASTEAPRSINSLTIAGDPTHAAKCSAVRPSCAAE